MTDFKLVFEALDENADLGQAAIVPWDTKIFSFPVGVLECSKAGDGRVLSAAVDRWMSRHEIGILSTSVPARDRALSACVQAAGFIHIETTLEATLARVQKRTFRSLTSNLRDSVEDDRDEIVRIASEAFSFGRFHADPVFPRELANRRYGWWMENALKDAANTREHRVFVLGPPGEVQGFFHVRLVDGVADLRLGAVDPGRASGILGPALYHGVAGALQSEGATKIVARISAANTGVMNLYCDLGFLFGDPVNVYHRHAA